MTRFIAETLGVALISLAIAFGISGLHQSPIHPTDSSIPQNIELANMGSSHGQYGFNYAEKGNYQTHNFGMMSQSFWYDWSIVDYYSDHFEKGAVLLLPVSYFSFWYDELGDPQFQVKNERYYSMLDLSHIRFDGWRHRIAHGFFSLFLLPDNWTGSIFKLALNAPHNSELSREEIGRWKASTHIADYDMQDESGNALPAKEENVEMLKRLLQECQESDITPVMITTPYLDYYSRWFGDGFQDYFHVLVDSISREYGVEYWDYSHDERFAHSEELFSDTDHLNASGARLFTEIVVSRLLEEGLLESK